MLPENIQDAKKSILRLVHGAGLHWQRPLISRIYTRKHMYNAYLVEKKRRPPAGADKESWKMFATEAGKNLAMLRQQVIMGTYRPVTPRWVRPPGAKKAVGLLTFRDRIVQRTLKNYFSTQWDSLFSRCSYGFRPGKSYHDAQKRVLQLCLSHEHIAVVDIQDFFGSVLHPVLFRKLSQAIDCPRTVDLIMNIVQSGSERGRGIPRGGILSPLLANLYLNRFDHAVTRCAHMVRYCDDIALPAKTSGSLKRSLRIVQNECRTEGLHLNKQKTQISTYRQGFSLLGTHFKKA